MKTQKQCESEFIEFIAMLLFIFMASAIVIGLMGCASNYGWEFHVGVSPIKKIDNKEGLDQEVDNESRLDGYEKPLTRKGGD